MASFIVVTVFGQTPDVKVTFQSAAAPLSKVIPALGKVVGISMTAEGPISNSVVFVKVKDLEMSKVMAQIAKVTSGKWQKHEESYQLVLSEDAAKEERQAEVTADAHYLERVVTSIEKGLVRKEDGSGGFFFPENEALYRIYRLIGFERFARQEHDQRVVYAYPSNSMQVAFPPVITQVVSQLIRDKNAEAAKNDQPLLPTPVKILCSVVNGPDFATPLQVQATLVDSNGRAIAQMGCDFPAVKALSLSPATVELRHPKELITLSESSKLLCRYSQTPFMLARGVIRADDNSPTDSLGVDELRLLDSTISAINKPTERDPLDWVIGDALNQLGEIEQVNIVACLPDSAWQYFVSTFFANGPKTVSEFIKKLTTDARLRLNVQDGSYLIMPYRPDQSRQARVNRKSLEGLMKILAKEGQVNLDQLAEFVSTQPYVEIDRNFEAAYVGLVNRSLGRRLANSLYAGERRLLQFYRSLSGGQKLALQAGKSIPLTSLLGGQKVAFNQILFSKSSRLDKVLEFSDPQIATTSLREITELIPNGVRGGELSLSVDSDKAIFGVTESGERVNLSDHRDQQEVAKLLKLFKKFQVGSIINYRFRFLITPDAWFTRTVSVDSFNRNSPLLERDEVSEMLSNLP